MKFNKKNINISFLCSRQKIDSKIPAIFYCMKKYMIFKDHHGLH